MDIAERVNHNKTYGKYKLLVKKWEKEFIAKNSRIPSKLDIKEAPAKVRYAYKQYFQMKSAALEESLLDCPLDEAVVEAASPEFPPIFDSMFDISSPNSDFIIENLPSTSQIVELLSSKKLPAVDPESKAITINNNSQDLNSKETCSKTNNRISQNASKKLFENSKFSMRNPRKSNSLKLSQNKPNDESTKTDLAESEVINTQMKAQPLLTNPSVDYKINNLSEETALPSLKESSNIFNKYPVREINLGWLERATGEKLDIPNNCVTKSESQKYGIANIDTSISEKLKHIDYVENSESETEERASSQTLKPALKKRKLENVQENQFRNEYPTNKSIECDVQNPTDEKFTEISISSNKSNRRKVKPAKRRIYKENGQNKKHIDDTKPPIIEDFVCIDIERDLVPRFEKESLKVDAAKQETGLPNTNTVNSSNEALKKKVEMGTLNENFVKINIKKKVFVRGKKSFNYSKFKKQVWKDKKALTHGMEFPEGGKVACFKCGNHGHMARYCTAHHGDTLLPLDVCHADEIPTLNDMENNPHPEPENNAIETISQSATSAIPDSFLELLSQSSQKLSQHINEVQPIYENYPNDETSNEIREYLKMFGHQSFRPGQEEAIKRILSGLSTLLILSTGSGKSLCYQLPAYIYSKHYKCVTLVISPLVSLMDDQVLGMPEFLKAGCLHTNQTLSQRQKIMQYLKDGELNVLLISPEALITGDRSSGIGSLFKNLPPIAFACIDEAHCVSQWSHNFRPSYLMICRVLREKLKVNCILGLTATASQPTITSIIDHINVPDGLSGVITNPSLPPNLILTVSHEKDKDRSLVTLLGSEPFASYTSIIVYCIRRDECQRVASMLRSTFQEPGKVMMESSKKRKKMSYLAEAYHAGLSAAQRRKIQDNFMNGSLKIIVATVAFGMGINKSDIRCIVHYNMPKSFESYVQEVGRAGRDGKIAHCHVFTTRNNDDKNELLKHIHSNSIDRHVIRKLLQKVFVPCECRKKFIRAGCSDNRCMGHEVAFSIDDTVEELDTASENISTMLCYLELHPKKYVQVLNNCYIMCKIHSYGGPQKLLDAAKTCPPLAMAYTLGAKADGHIAQSSMLEFQIIDVAAAMGWESGIVKYQLKNLEWTKENGTSKRSALKVEFHTLGFRVRAPGDLKSSEMDEMLDNLHSRVEIQEKTMLYQLEEISKAFTEVATRTVTELFTSETVTFEDKSNELKRVIQNYFERESVTDASIEIEPRPLNEERALADIKALIAAYKDCTFTGRAIARILQGMPSPNYPALVWGRTKFWRSHIHEDFYKLARLATQTIIDMRY